MLFHKNVQLVKTFGWNSHYKCQLFPRVHTHAHICTFLHKKHP